MGFLSSLKFWRKKKSAAKIPENASQLLVGYDLKTRDLKKLHKTAAEGVEFPVVLVILKQKIKNQKKYINQLDKKHRTALHIACALGHTKVVEALVRLGAQLNLFDKKNQTALMKAVQGQHENCVICLLANNADPNLADINGQTALHIAASIPSLSMAELLLKHNADVNARDKKGLTPLGIAVGQNNVKMATLLLREGANVNATDNGYRSPLMMASGAGQISMVKLLLRNKADVTLTDYKGWTAKDFAVKNGHHHCSLIIAEHGTQQTDGHRDEDRGDEMKKLSAASQNTDVTEVMRFIYEGDSSDEEHESPTTQNKSKQFCLELGDNDDEDLSDAYTDSISSENSLDFQDSSDEELDELVTKLLKSWDTRRAHRLSESPMELNKQVLGVEFTTPQTFSSEDKKEDCSTKLGPDKKAAQKCVKSGHTNLLQSKKKSRKSFIIEYDEALEREFEQIVAEWDTLGIDTKITMDR